MKLPMIVTFIAGIVIGWALVDNVVTFGQTLVCKPFIDMLMQPSSLQRHGKESF